jgi:hypothetical protein
MLSGYNTRMSGHRGLIFHVAVSEAAFPSYSPGTGAHLYTRRNGGIVQQIDTNFKGGHSYQGNRTLLGVETQGGVIDPNNEPWSPEACEANAHIAAWANRTHGIPLHEMANSRSSSTGIGYHRQGVNGNFGPYAYGGRVSGGEYWSHSFGKICPGDAKIAQIPGIIARAKELVGAGEVIEVSNPVPAPIATAPTTGLAVDGNLGYHSIGAGQTLMGTPADGFISEPKSTFVLAVQTYLKAKGYKGRFWRALKIDGYGLMSNSTHRVGPFHTIAALQRYLKALGYYNGRIDGKLDAYDSLTIRAYQRAANNGVLFH